MLSWTGAQLTILPKHLGDPVNHQFIHLSRSNEKVGETQRNLVIIKKEKGD